MTLEFLHSSRDGGEFDKRMALFADLHDVPISSSVTNAPLGAYRELSHRRPLAHAL